MQAGQHQRNSSISHVLHQYRPVIFEDVLVDARRFFAANDFRIHIDETCSLPANWRSTWAAPLQFGGRLDEHWKTKYGAAGFIPRMIEQSPFLTEDWRKANASIVVLFARSYAGGPAIVQQQCLQRLVSRSAAWQATGGARHFFILTDDRGPCCLDGKYKDVRFLQHHIIGNHGEQPHHSTSDFIFRRGWGPQVPCFDERKDIMIPTPNLLPNAKNLAAAFIGTEDARKWGQRAM